MRPYTRTIATGTESRIAARGRTVFVVSSTAEIIVTMRAVEIGRKGGLMVGPVTMRAGNQFVAEQTFDDVILRNESGADNTVVVLIGVGNFQSPLTTIASAANAGTNRGAVSIGTSAAVILAANTSRANLLVQNLSVNDLYIGVDSGVTVANGIEVPPNGSVLITHAAAVWGIASGASSDVRYFEETI